MPAAFRRERPTPQTARRSIQRASPCWSNWLADTHHYSEGSCRPQYWVTTPDGSILATLTLLILTPAGTVEFWLVAGALAALITVQIIFWTKTQPANSFWLEETELSHSATRFFQTGEGSAPGDWMAARNQWERSHLMRALAASLGLFLLTVAQRYRPGRLRRDRRRD